MTSDRLVPNKRQSSLVAASLSFVLTLLLQGCGSKPAPTCDREDGCNGAEPGTFQRWVFAFEWQPTWAYDHCLDGHSPLEGHLKNDSFATSHLSIHGLWPEYFPSGPNNSLWPQFCTGAGVDFTDCNPPLAAKCKTSPATTSRYNTSQLWQQSAMEYAWGTLENYEWSKHGSCTGWTDSEYYNETYNSFNKLRSLPGPKMLEASASKSVSRKSLLAGFGQVPSLLCTDDCYLSEVWIMLEADPKTLLPLDAVDFPDPSKSCSKCKTITLPGLLSCPPPPTSCAPFQLGPPCTWDPYVSGTVKDPCKKYKGCARCARKTEHCTDVAEFDEEVVSI